MKKHHKKEAKEGSAAEEAMESPAEEAAEGNDGMKHGGKAKAKMKHGGKAKFARGGRAKHEMKAEGHAAKHHMGKPAKKASGGSIDSTDEGVTPSRPFAIGSPQRKSGGKC